MRHSGGSRILYGRVARWPKKNPKARRAEKIFLGPSRGVLKIECPRLAKNAFLAIERTQISSKISAVC